MKNRPSDASRRPSRPFFPATAFRQLDWLRNLGFLLLGAGLGTIGSRLILSPSASPENPVSISSSANTDRSSSSSTGNAPEKTLTSPRFAPSPAPNPSPQVEVSSATVCVKTPMGPNRQACASGVSIDPALVGVDPSEGSVVITNYHVISDMGERPPLQLGGSGQVFNAEILRQSPEFDLALLLVPKASFPIARLAEASPGEGTRVRAIGFPNNQPLTINDSSLLGKTQNCLAVSPCLALQQGTITFGNSGGPLEADGEVIGITQGEIVDEIAIPVEQVRQFLAGENPPPGSRRPPDYPGGPSGPSGPMGEPPYYPPMRPAYPPGMMPPAYRGPSYPPPYPPPGYRGPYEPPYPAW